MSRALWSFAWLFIAAFSLQLWKHTGDIWWTFASSAFAVASIREMLLLIKEVKRQ